MIKKRPETFIVNKNIPDEEIPQGTRICFNILKDNYGYTARMSDFIQLLSKTYEITFELFNPLTWNSGEFLSYLIDIQKKYMSGDNIDLSILHTDILKVYQWTLQEKRMFIEGDIEQRLWAILLIITNPAHEKYNIN